jgi:hypothetical protein
VSARLVLLLLLAGCVTGRPAESFAPARSAAGADLQLGDGRPVGELIAVTDSTIVVRAGTLLAEAAFHDLPALYLTGAARAYHFGGTHRAPPAETLAWLRAASRFPQGLRPAWRDALMAEFHQATYARLDLAAR